MSGVVFDAEGTAFWEQDGNFSQITRDSDGDYLINDEAGDSYVLDANTVNAALLEESGDYVTRGEFYQGVAAASVPQPDLEELEAQAQAEEDAEAIAEEDAQWLTELGENIHFLEHRLGEPLSDEERNAIYEDASKNGHTDPASSLEEHWAERSTSDGRRRLAAKAAQEAMDAARERDAEDAELAEHEDPDPVREMEPREGLIRAVEDSQVQAAAQEAQENE